MCEKMKIYDDARLLGGWANHEEARWNKGGGIPTIWGGEFLRRVSPPNK